MAESHRTAMDPDAAFRSPRDRSVTYQPTDASGPQADLFASGVGSGRRQVPANGLRNTSPQSLAAREAVQPTVRSTRQRVAGVILAAGAQRITRLEVVRKTGFLRGTVNGRVRECLDDLAMQTVERYSVAVCIGADAARAVLQRYEALGPFQADGPGWDLSDRSDAR